MSNRDQQPEIECSTMGLAAALEQVRIPNPALDREQNLDPALNQGQILQVPCLNINGLKPWDCGLWSETDPPSALRGRLLQPQRYLTAMQRINKVHKKKVWFRSDAAEAGMNMMLVLCVILSIGTAIFFCQTPDTENAVASVAGVLATIGGCLTYWKKMAKRILNLLQKAVGRANALLWEEDLLIGCASNSELLVVHVPLNACRERLGHRFDSVLKKYSCAYVCCLAQRQADSAPPLKEHLHLQGAPCFCQFVEKQECCSCWW